MYKPLFFVCLALLSSVLLSCYNDKNTFGDKWVNSELRNISMDTSTIITTAVLIDSLEIHKKNYLEEKIFVNGKPSIQITIRNGI